jgi:hypothetical protein
LVGRKRDGENCSERKGEQTEKKRRGEERSREKRSREGRGGEESVQLSKHLHGTEMDPTMLGKNGALKSWL